MSWRPWCSRGTSSTAWWGPTWTGEPLWSATRVRRAGGSAGVAGGGGGGGLVLPGQCRWGGWAGPACPCARMGRHPLAACRAGAAPWDNQLPPPRSLPRRLAAVARHSPAGPRDAVPQSTASRARAPRRCCPCASSPTPGSTPPARWCTRRSPSRWWCCTARRRQRPRCAGQRPAALYPVGRRRGVAAGTIAVPAFVPGGLDVQQHPGVPALPLHLAGRLAGCAACRWW